MLYTGKCGFIVHGEHTVLKCSTVVLGQNMRETLKTQLSKFVKL
jgi:hypothetical protein